MNNLLGQFKGVDDLLFLINSAIQNKNNDILYYNELIEMAPSDEEKEILTEIVNDEKKHFNYFKEIIEINSEQTINPSLNLFIDISDTYINNIKLAKLNELESVKYYRDILFEFTDTINRNLMFEIITDEFIHAHLLDYIININIEIKITPPIRVASNKKKTTFTLDEANKIAKKLGIDFNKEPFDLEQFRMGLDVELEHGLVSPKTNVTNDDPILTGKIALAHLNEFPDYYTRLKKFEQEAKLFWGK